MKKIIILSSLIIFTLLITGCQQQTSFDSCFNKCIDIQCTKYNQTTYCNWANYEDYIYPDRNDNALVNLTYQQVQEMKQTCFNECKNQGNNS